MKNKKINNTQHNKKKNYRDQYYIVNFFFNIL